MWFSQAHSVFKAPPSSPVRQVFAYYCYNRGMRKETISAKLRADSAPGVSRHMTFDDVTALVENGEPERLELKKTTGTRSEAAKAICAMLNQDGGHVLFGFSPNGEAVGLNIGEGTIESVSEEMRRIDPGPPPNIDRIAVPGKGREVLVVSVTRGRDIPYRYKGHAYRRVGNTTVAMSSLEQNWLVLEDLHGRRRWETEVAEGWTIEDIDADRVRKVISMGIRENRIEDPNTEDVSDLLRGLSLLDGDAPLNAAAVLFGKTSRLKRDMPRCKLRLAWMPDAENTEYIDNRQYHGNAFELFDIATSYLHRMLPISSRMGDDMKRIDIPAYPPLAVREAMANALCHRDYSNLSGGSIHLAVYSDRLEIASPGPLHFGLVPEDLFASHESLAWNPLIANAFYLCGIIEEWGTGTLKMEKWAREIGLQKPEISDTGRSVKVCFWGNGTPQPAQAETYQLSESQRAVLDLLAQSELPLTLKEIHSALNLEIGDRQLRRVLAVLKKQGLAHPTGRTRATLWRHSRP